MKTTFSIFHRLAKCLLLLTLPVIAADTNQNTKSEAPARDAEVDQGVLEDAKAEVQDRVDMSAPMELPEEGEEDFVAIAEKEGWITDVTLEEVEAALNAAKATPSKDDDIAAMRLAHRGSYRFYVDEAAAATESETESAP